MTSDTTTLSPAEPTNTQKLKGIPWSLGFNVLNTFFVQFTFFGSVFVLFLDELGLGKTEIGFLLALLPLFDLISLLIAGRVNRVGYKRSFITFWGLRTIVTALLLLVPLVQARYANEGVLVWTAIIIIGFAICRSVAVTALMPWQQEFIPATMWGKYSALNNNFTSLAGLAAVTIAGVVVGGSSGQERFMLLFGLALAFGFASVWSAGFIPGGAPAAPSNEPQEQRSGRSQALRDRRFVYYLIGAALVSLATVPLGAFVPLFMQDDVGLSSGSIVLLTNGFMVGGLVSGYLWGWAADRYGSRPVALFGIVFTILLPALWLVMPRLSPWSFPVALGISFLRGALLNAWAIGSSRLLYVSVVPSEQKAAYLSIYTAVMGVVAAISQVGGGWLLDVTSEVRLALPGFELNSYTLMFLSGMGLATLSALVISGVRTDARLSVSQFAGLFLHGNPLAAMESLIRYHLARDESSTVTMTERLGQAKSPLTVDELLEALADPRFYVRFEAMISIARHTPDERLLAALASKLHGQDPSLSVIAAWAMGRLGDAQAVEPLRRALNSSYRSVRAHAARSLGSLEDRASAEMLLNRLETEQDHGLQVAYAAALGRMKHTPAAPRLLALLATEVDPEARQELALALARLNGDENLFVQTWRAARSDPGTTYSRPLVALRRLLSEAGYGESADLPALQTATDLLERQQIDAGLAALADWVDTLPADLGDPTRRLLLAGCAAGLKQHGSQRSEYAWLAIHVLSHLPISSQ